ncbi:MAG: hypothetical protein F6K19_24090 [Cyanothece sp. SIO1E1]|nr:hypothetical protein [Cyanothece sp. SIO1E1]
MERTPEKSNSSTSNIEIFKNSYAGRDVNIGNIRYIEQYVEISTDKVKEREFDRRSPYKGLKSFEAIDKSLFFGRDELIQQLILEINENPLTFILGASGSGKSSLVRAGIISGFEKMLGEKQYDFVFTPGRNPFESFRRSLLSQEKGYKFSESDVEILDQPQINTLVKVIESLRKGNTRWFIFIDQFEEIFNDSISKELRQYFIDGIIEVFQSNNSFVRIVIAMRSDFLDQVSSYPKLANIINQRKFHLMTEMYPDQLKQVIKRPAAKHGVVFESEKFVDRIIADVRGEKGYLPLLQYTLDLLWESERKTSTPNGQFEIDDRILNEKTYDELGGVRGALQQRVDTIYRGLNTEDQKATKQIFLKLVNFSDADTDTVSKPVRHIAFRSDFSESAQKVIDLLVDEKLLVSDTSPTQKSKKVDKSQQRDISTVEVAHEILFSSWAELKQWLKDKEQAIRLYRSLGQDVERWVTAKRKSPIKAEKELLRGIRLTQFIELSNSSMFDDLGGLSSEQLQFIQASIAEYSRNTVDKTRENLKRKEALDRENWFVPKLFYDPLYSIYSQTLGKAYDDTLGKLHLDFIEPKIKSLDELISGFSDTLGMLSDVVFWERISDLARMNAEWFDKIDSSDEDFSADLVKYVSLIDGVKGGLTGWFSVESTLLTVPIDISTSWIFQAYIICLVAHVYGSETSNPLSAKKIRDEALIILFTSEEEVLNLFNKTAVVSNLRKKSSGDAARMAATAILKDVSKDVLKKLIGKIVDKSVRKFLEKIVPFVFGAGLSAGTCWWDTVQAGKRAILFYSLEKDDRERAILSHPLEKDDREHDIVLSEDVAQLPQSSSL